MKAFEYSGSFNLLPCPFCDEDKNLEVVCGGGRCPHCGELLGCWYCRCNECGATTGTRDTLDQAVEEWNGASRGKDRGCTPPEQEGE